MRELHDRDDAEAWLAGGLTLMRLASPAGDARRAVTPWLLGVLTESGTLPPVGVIADVGYLALGRSLSEAPPLPPLDPRLRGAISAYEDHLLGRLEADPWLEPVIDAIAGLPAHRRAHAIALLAARLLTRLEFAAGVALAPGPARAVARRDDDDVARAGYAAVTAGGAIFDALVAGYEGLVHAARRAPALLGQSEVFLLENLDVLGELTQRIAIDQMIEAADALARSLPRRLKPKKDRPVRGHIPTPLHADDNYPTGGFSAISTSGALENLVISELIYMEDSAADVRLSDTAAIDDLADADRVPGAVGGDVDLFDLRYAEGELLYYTRDESVFVRNHRVITFALMPDLVAARVKDADVRWQRLVVVMGLIACAVRKLAAWLDAEGLRFRIAFLGGSGDDAEHPLAAERGLIALLVGEFIEKQMAEVVTLAGMPEVLALAGEEARRADSDLICIAMGDALPETPPPGVLVGAMNVSEPAPQLTWAHARARPAQTAPQSSSASVASSASSAFVSSAASQATLSDPDGAWSAWTGAVLALLQEIL